MEDCDGVDPTRLVTDETFREFDCGENVSGDWKWDEDELCFLLLRHSSGDFFLDQLNSQKKTKLKVLSYLNKIKKISIRNGRGYTCQRGGETLSK